MKEEMEMLTVALRGLTVLPNMIVHLDISRSSSMEAANRAMEGDQKLFLVSQKDTDVTAPGKADLYRVGTIAIIKQIARISTQVTRILIDGKQRAMLLEMVQEVPCLIAKISPMETEGDMETNEEQARIRVIKDMLVHYIAENPKASKELHKALEEEMDLASFLDQVAGNLPLSQRVRQNFLEIQTLPDRYAFMVQLLKNEIEITHLKKDFQKQVKDRIDKNQKEYILREQLKVIREELGDTVPMNEADTYLEKLKKLKADKEVKEKLEKEIKRFRNLPGGSQEASVAQNYIETLLEMPWNKGSREVIDLKKAETILNEDHYGLEKVKERILEYLAVRKLNGKGESPILCLVGPPGTGKTSIAKSVARALNRKYVRISLGGIRDEAEIRGHRKTYVGAMPGRIAAGIRQAGVKNPLMLLDELDKVSSDYTRGDTASALLEVLDGGQNSKFRDHYLEVPLNLSEVLFIATANTAQTIPGPLLDRMEIIEINSYTENEKFHIGKEHLLKKQLDKHGLTADQLVLEDDALRGIIRHYTREAGVRGLERQIGKICRKAARQILEDHAATVVVGERDLEEYLGKEKMEFDTINEQDEVGIVRGLAWTSVGGDTLQIEVNVMPGKGNMQLTGQMGDVMKESAQIALSYIRSIASRYQVADDFFETHDLHIHIPEGAVPKDGPSAGITMATAMLSAVTGRKVRREVAMTGEITLRGKVLPIGGLKEKLLVAKMAGVKTVLVPEKNRTSVEEISREITDGLRIVFVSDMDEVIGEAFLEVGE